MRMSLPGLGSTGHSVFGVYDKQVDDPRMRNVSHDVCEDSCYVTTSPPPPPLPPSQAPPLPSSPPFPSLSYNSLFSILISNSLSGKKYCLDFCLSGKGVNTILPVVN